MKIEIKNIKPNPKNPRQEYNKQELKELSQSMQSMGQLTPLKLDDKLRILGGHRRYFAAKKIGWKQLECKIMKGLTTFEKSAVLISDNATQVSFKAWEHREAIANIYWDEFLEEYSPKSSKDKGYTTFAKKLGLSVSHVKKIVESTSRKNRKYYNKLKAAGCAPNTVDEVMTASEDMRAHLAEVAINHQKRNRGMSTGKVRDHVRAVKQNINLSKEDSVSPRHFKVLRDRVESLGIRLVPELIKNGDYKELNKLHKDFNRFIIPFYKRLQKAIS